MKRTRTKLSVAIENFKISQVEKELELPKVLLKSENQKIILHKTHHNFVKNATSFVLSKKCLDVCEPNKHKMNTRHFCHEFLFCFAPQQSQPPPPTQWGKGGYNISCSDIRYFQLRISVNTLPHCSYILAPKFWVWPK